MFFHWYLGIIEVLEYGIWCNCSNDSIEDERGDLQFFMKSVRAGNFEHHKYVVHC